MKSIKLALITILVLLTMADFAPANGNTTRPNQDLNIDFSQAIQNPGLVVAMYGQLDPDFLSNNQELYVAHVSYDGVLYHILGSRQKWTSYFSMKWKYLMVSLLWHSVCLIGSSL